MVTRAIAQALTLAVLLPAAAAAENLVWDNATIVADTTWSGGIVLRQNVVVEGNAVLRVLPGTAVTVAAGKGIGITVLGRLSVEGDGAGDVRFVPEKGAGERGAWEGIRLAGEGAGREGHVLSGFRIEGARTGVQVSGNRARLLRGTFSGCGTALQGDQKSSMAVDNCSFLGNDVGATVSLGGAAVFRGCRFDNVLKAGIVADKGAVFRVSECSFSRGKTGIYSLTNAPCRIEESAFSSLEAGLSALQMGGNSAVSRCSFENGGAGVVVMQFGAIEVADSTFRGNKAGIAVRDFSSPAIHHNRFEGNETAVDIFRKSHARVERNIFVHNRNAVVVNYSSYPLIGGNNFDRNDMAVRLEKFQSGDWEERKGSPGITSSEASRRGSRVMPSSLPAVVFPKKVNAKGNWWGPDADRDAAAGTLGKIWDGKKFGPVRYEGSGDEEYRIDVVDFSEEVRAPVADAGPRPKAAPGAAGDAK